MNGWTLLTIAILSVTSLIQSVNHSRLTARVATLERTTYHYLPPLLPDRCADCHSGGK